MVGDDRGRRWCICGGADTCLGCLIERLVEERLGSMASEYLRRRVNVRDPESPPLTCPDCGERAVATETVSYCPNYSGRPGEGEHIWGVGGLVEEEVD